ncbi:MAG: DNA repair protein RadC [Gammaproteobacteria bacterium]|nr:DNA repair protein RadC [Gammaproteobacteria bacterium]
MAISDWPKMERPREKLLQRGAASLSDAELLAIFLRTGVKGKSAVDLARELLIEHGSLRTLLDSSQAEFCRSYGLGVAKYCQLKATLEMAQRYLITPLKRGDVFTNPAAVSSYLLQRLRGESRELFHCLFLDNKNRLIVDETLFLGTINQSVVHPREVIKRALELNASALILSHNHPSGICDPSRADIEITHRIKDALELVDIRLLDHLIVGDQEVLSLAERGLMESI